MDGHNKSTKSAPNLSLLNSITSNYSLRSSPDRRPPQGGEPTLIAGDEGSHLAQLFTPGVGTRLSRQGYGGLLDQLAANLEARPAVYIHLPFCPSRCLSCDKITTVSHDGQGVDRYLDNLDREMALYAAKLGEGRQLAQLHLGGGTPNYLTEAQLLRLMTIIERYFSIGHDTEMSLEASPKRSSFSQLQLLKGLGFRSVDFQLRDLDATVQRSIGRSNTLAVLEDVFRNARDVGIEALGVDLVYGLPEQTVASISRSAADLVQLAPDRISCQAFARRSREFSHHSAISPSVLPSLADRLILFNAIVDVMEGADYQWVGLDSFMRATDRFAVAQRENQLYRNWVGYNLHGGATVLGFGASAISEVGSACVSNYSTVEEWQASLGGGELPIRAGILLSEQEQARRRAVNGLFCNLRLDDLEPLAGVVDVGAGLDRLEQEGVISVHDGSIAVTPTGRLLLHHTCGGYRAREHAWASGW